MVDLHLPKAGPHDPGGRPLGSVGPAHDRGPRFGRSCSNRFRETLAGKELDIFDQRMIAEEPLTLQELGDKFGVTRERVRQLESRVAGRLRTFLRECLGDATEIDSD